MRLRIRRQTEKGPMTKLNEYFDNELSAQEQLEIQMGSPSTGTARIRKHSWPNFRQPAHRRRRSGPCGFRASPTGSGSPRAAVTPSRRARIVAWSQRIAAILVVPLLCAVWLLYADRKPEAEWLEQQVPYGEMASLTLPDGTQLHLNSGSRITYPSAFTGKERRIFVPKARYSPTWRKIPANLSSSSRAKSASAFWAPASTSSPTRIPTVSRCCWSKAPSGSTIDAPTRKQQLTMKPGDMVQYDRATGDIDLTTFQPGHFKSFADDRAIHFFNLRMRDISLGPRTAVRHAHRHPRRSARPSPLFRLFHQQRESGPDTFRHQFRSQDADSAPRRSHLPLVEPIPLNFYAEKRTSHTNPKCL